MTPWATTLMAGLFLAMVLGGMVLLGVTLIGRQRIRELAIKERIALIERGLVPSPEVDQARFETLVGLRRPINSKSARYRSAGVTVMGLGAAMMVLLTFAAGVPETGFGVGGGLLILGLATFINGVLAAGDEPASPGSARS
jgi:hypothetical protein